MSDDKVLVEYDGKYSWRVIANTPEAGRRMIVTAVRESGYTPSTSMLDIDNYIVTPLSELMSGVVWR